MRNFFSNTSLLAIIACLLWSSAFVWVKIGLQHTSPLQFAGIRFMIAGLLILPFCGTISSYINDVTRHFKTVLLTSFCQTFLLYTFFYLGMDLLPASIGALIIGSQPLIIAAMAHLATREDKITPRKGISMVLGFIGVAIICMGRGDLSITAGSQFLGIVLLLASNVSSGVANLYVSRNKVAISALTLNSAQLFMGGLLLFALSLPTEGFTLRAYPREYYYALTWLSLLSASAFSIWFTLLKRPGIIISELNIWKFLIPLSGAGLSWLIMDNESPDVLSITGMACITIALVILHVRRKG